METQNPDMSAETPVKKDAIILATILIAIFCIGIGVAAGGYFAFEKYTETQAISQTATSQFMATKIKQDTNAQATVQAQATVTALVSKIQSTATAQAKTNLLASYTYYDAFDSNLNEWRVAEEDNDFWLGRTSIENGSYLWQVDEAKDIFIAWADFTSPGALTDFDASVLAQRTNGLSENVCYGMLFRKTIDGIDAGSYAFSVCDHGYFSILYYDESTGWETIQDWTETTATYQDQPNLLEISARGSDFTLFINSQQVAQFSDDRLKEGYVALFLDFYEKEPGAVWFDNFAMQPR
jgi:hypothetical protein